METLVRHKEAGEALRIGRGRGEGMAMWRSFIKKLTLPGLC